MGCVSSSSKGKGKRLVHAPGYERAILASQTFFAFKLYDLRGTGYIEKEELREMILALLDESDLFLLDKDVEAIVYNPFSQADSNSDGRIDYKEWEEFFKNYPSSLRNMSLPYLQDITMVFPSFQCTQKSKITA